MNNSNGRQRLADLIAGVAAENKKKAANTAEKGTIQGKLVCIGGRWMPYKISTDIIAADGQTVICLVNHSRTGAYIVGR